MKNICFCFLLLIVSKLSSQNLPKGFVHLNDVAPTIQSDLKYCGHHNFIGLPVNGYEENVVITSTPTATALKKVQDSLLKKGLSLKIFDAYRPQQAVDYFVRWAKVLNDTLQKKEFYPDVPKSQLFNLGFIASKSGHTRGSTVDLTIVDLKTGKDLDMGSSYDFFGKISHPFYKNVSKEQQQNRMLLRNIMLANGFRPYENEWWHFTLKNEPFPNTYFNFPVK